MNENSLEAYENIKPELKTREAEVYDIIDRHPEGVTMRRVAELLNVSIHQISGRFGALTHEKKRLVIIGKVKIGRNSHSLYVTDKNFKSKKQLTLL